MNADDASLLGAPPNPDSTVSGDPPNSRIPQYIAAITATLSAVSAGAVLGWTSPILTEVQHGNFHNISVNTQQMGWIGSFATLGAMFTCIPTGFLCDLIGRKSTLLFLIVPFSCGWALIIFSRSIITLYFGRLVTGIAAGATCIAAPLYTSEIGHKEIRGSLGSCFQLMVTIGIFLAYLAETPAYFLGKGSYNAALNSLTKLRGGTSQDNERELSEIELSLKEDSQSVSLLSTLKEKSFRKAFLIAFALMFFQQFSGINCILFYTSDVFTSAGVKLDSNTAAILVGGFQALSTFFSSLLIDKLGRKILLYTSSGVMALSCVPLAAFFTLKDRFQLDAKILSGLGFIPVVSLCVFVIVFSVGLGPIPWMISSEIFSPQTKSIAGSCAGTFNWFLAFLLTKFYLEVNDAVGQDTTFYFFAGVSLSCAVFVHFFVPETRGKSVEEVRAELGE